MEEWRLKEIIAQWRIKADHDLALVEHDIRDNDPLTDALCFHCQQAAEKYLKLYLIAQKTDYPKVHDIAELLETCRKLDASFESLKELSYLTNYAVELRYPDNFYIPSIEELRKAYEDAKKVRDFVLKRVEF